MKRPFSGALFPPTLVAFSLSFDCLPSARGSTPAENGPTRRRESGPERAILRRAKISRAGSALLVRPPLRQQSSFHFATRHSKAAPLLPRFRPHAMDRAVGADPPQLTPHRLGNGR